MRLYEEGLIFRAKRMINWDPASQTVVSDLEVDTAEENGSLWSHPVSDRRRRPGEIVVATTRPETMLGDTAVAVHPNDERYKHAHRQGGRAAADRARRSPIDRATAVSSIPAFGTGAVKVTPAHDPNDYEVGQRDTLPMLNVIDSHGKIMRAGAGEVRRHDRRRRRARRWSPISKPAASSSRPSRTRCRAAAASARAR